MSALKAVRNLRRLRKETYQFKFTSKFEYITLSCTGTWRPTKLRVIWFRSHRRVESIPVSWVVREDRGPNGAEGRGQFRPAFSVGLIVTLYKNTGAFEEKEYKYYIQDESEKGNKIVASFTINLAEYAHIDGSEDKLEMTFCPESRKVNNVILGMTLSCQFLKKGNETDDDMQSTYSAMTMDQEILNLDSEEEEVEEGRDGRGHKSPQNATPTTGHVRTELPSATSDGGSPCVPVSSNAKQSGVLRDVPVSHSPDVLSRNGHIAWDTHSPNPLRSSQTNTPVKVPKRREIAATTGPSTVSRRSIVAAKGVTGQQNLTRVSSASSLPPPSPPPTLLDGNLRPTNDANETITKLKEAVQRLEEERKFFHASMEVQGWLYKRGVKGPTARVWRRRYFRCEEGSKICYYKTRHARTPQGFIDLDLVLGVEEVEPSLQDKNSASFLVRCEGRTFQLLAMDHSTMMKWMSAIEFLVHWRKECKQKEEREAGTTLFPGGQ